MISLTGTRGCRRGCPLALFAAFGLVPLVSPRAAAAAEEPASAPVHDAGFLFALVAILLAAKLGGELFERWGQPAVLGELTLGVVLGNLGLLGVPFVSGLGERPDIAMVADLGVILLLFEVGLESDLGRLLAVGGSAFLVATLGVIAPSVLGYAVSAWLLPEAAWPVHVFVGATLAATSVGISARVLKDLGKTASAEGRIILGAAVVDDVMGLVVLAVVSGLVTSVTAGGAAHVSIGPIAVIVIKATAFLVGAVFFGRLLAGPMVRAGAGARVPGLALTLSVVSCFVLAGLAEIVGLAPIVGAFAAGLTLEDVHFEGYRRKGMPPIQELVSPVTSLLVPVFFVHMGLRVDLLAFTDPSVVGLALALTVAAVLGKQVCSLGVIDRGVDRVAVGIGMIPRGEVGLIFAGIGSSLLLAGTPVLSPRTFSALVITVMLTTLVTPPLLRMAFRER
jgi:Kef-type K+ transport system membrane component KefB